MIFLFLTILFSASLFVIFKFLDKKGAHLLTAIIVNYLVCILLGYLNSPEGAFANYDAKMVVLHICFGFLFFGVFYLMGKSSAINGVGITGAAGKMSLLLSSTLLSFIYNTALGWMNFISIALAIYALILLSKEENTIVNKRQLWLPFFIFLGSGIIDTCLAITKQFQISKAIEQGPSIVFIFLGAFIISTLVNLYGSNKNQKLQTKSIPYGIILGIINYFSIHFLFLAIENRGNLNLNNFTIINNTGIVLLTFIAGIGFFGEKLGLKRVFGILLAIISIILTLNI